MGHHSEAFIGIDTAKLRNAVAVAEAGRKGEVRYLGEIDTSEAATRKLIAGLAARHRKLTFCYEAGPTGYGLQRLIESLGHTCLVVAPSLIPKKAGDRVKTNRRDAEGLARLLRAGELTAVWVPHARHEAMRELTRARDAARQDLTRKRQQVSSMLLRLGWHYPGIKTWNVRHRSWLANLKLEHYEQRFALEEMLQAERQAGERIGRLSSPRPPPRLEPAHSPPSQRRARLSPEPHPHQTPLPSPPPLRSQFSPRPQRLPSPHRSQRPRRPSRRPSPHRLRSLCSPNLRQPQQQALRLPPAARRCSWRADH